MAETKKNILTYEGLKALEDELHELKVNRRREVCLLYTSDAADE